MMRRMRRVSWLRSVSIGSLRYSCYPLLRSRGVPHYGSMIGLLDLSQFIRLIVIYGAQTRMREGADMGIVGLRSHPNGLS